MSRTYTSSSPLIESIHYYVYYVDDSCPASLYPSSPRGAKIPHLGYSLKTEEITGEKKITFIPRGIWSTSKAVPKHLYQQAFEVPDNTSNQLSVVYYLYEQGDSIQRNVGDWEIVAYFVDPEEAAEYARSIRLTLENQYRGIFDRLILINVFTSSVDQNTTRINTVVRD